MEGEVLRQAILVAVGLCAGTVGAFVGIGGGIIIVPILTLAYGFAPQAAAGTSLAVIFFNMISASIGHGRRNRIHYKSGIWLALATIPGALAGAWLSTMVSPLLFRLAFGILLLFVAVTMVIRGIRDNAEIALADIRYSPTSLSAGLIISFLVGCVAVILGVGGGLFQVPIMTFLLGFPMKIAVATSCFCLTFTALAGAAAYATSGNINLAYGIPLTIGTVVGAQIGSWATGKIKSNIIRYAFSVILLIVALRMIVLALDI